MDYYVRYAWINQKMSLNLDFRIPLTNWMSQFGINDSIVIQGLQNAQNKLPVCIDLWGRFLFKWKLDLYGSLHLQNGLGYQVIVNLWTQAPQLLKKIIWLKCNAIMSKLLQVSTFQLSAETCVVSSCNLGHLFRVHRLQLCKLSVWQIDPT